MSEYAKQKITQAVAAYIKKAEDHYGRVFGMPEIQFTLKGRTSGSARIFQHHLDFNLQIFQENESTFLIQTVGHEVAHRVAIMLYGTKDGKGHGRCWKAVMSSAFGLEPKRCHNYEVAHLKARKTRLWKYSCPCSIPHVLTTTKHNRLMADPKNYRCGCCGGFLTFVGEHQAEMKKAA